MAWVWSDDLLRQLMADGGAVPEHARTWLHAPIALRVERDEHVPDLAALLDLDGLSTVSKIARTMSPPAARCTCGAESADAGAGELGAAG